MLVCANAIGTDIAIIILLGKGNGIGIAMAVLSVSGVIAVLTCCLASMIRSIIITATVMTMVTHDVIDTDTTTPPIGDAHAE